MGQFYAAPPVQEKPKKKKGKKVLITIVSIVAVLALLVGLAFVIFPDQAKAIFAKVFYSDIKYFRMLEKDELEDVADDVADYYVKFKESSDGENKVKGKLSAKASIDDTILSSLTSGVDIDLSWLTDIGVDFVTDTADGVNAGVAEISLSRGKALTVEYKLDSDGGKVYVRIPELSEKYIAIDSSDLSDITSGLSALNPFGGYEPNYDYDDDYDYDEDDDWDDYDWDEDFGSDLGMSIMGEMTEAMKNLYTSIDEDDLEMLIRRYGEIVIDNIESVDKSSETLEIEGISEKLDVYSANLTEKDLMRIINAVFEELKKDEDVKRIVNDLAPIISQVSGGYIDEDDVYDSFIDSIDEALDSIKDQEKEASDDVWITYKIRVNSEGEVTCHEVIGSEDNYEFYGLDMYYNKVENDGKIAFEGKLDASLLSGLVSGYLPMGSSFSRTDLLTTYTVVGSGSEDGDRFTGDAVIYADVYGDDEDVLKLTFKDFDMESVKDGELRGGVKISVGGGLSDLMEYSSSSFIDNESILQALTQVKLDCDFDYDDGVQKFDISINLLTQKIASISGSFDKEVSGVDTSIPSSRDYVGTDDGEALQEWAETWDLDSFLKGLRSAGLPSELCDGIEGALGGTSGED